MAITPLPPNPARTDSPPVFVTKADNWVAALNLWTTEANALQVDVNAKQVAASNSAEAALVSENNADISEFNAASSAAAAALSVAASPNASGTSTSSNTISTGSKTFTTQTGKAFVVGSFVQVAVTASPAQNWMNGAVTAYDSGTGVITVEVSAITGGGTFAAWTISISAPINLSGVGGAVLSGNVTLTSTSPAAMTVTPTAPGQYVTLPSATTINKAVPLFSVYNAGDSDYGIKDFSGNKLGWIRPRTGAVIGLSDSTTSTGVWACYGLEKLGVTAKYANIAITSGLSIFQRIDLDSSRTFFLTGSGSTGIYGIVYDASTQTWGNPTVVGSSTGMVMVACLSGPNQILCCYTVVGASADIAARVLTVAGTTISAYAPAASPSFGSGTPSAIHQVIPVGSSYVVSFTSSAEGSAIRALTISANLVTWGAASGALSPGGVTSIKMFAVGNTVRTIINGVSSPIYAKPFTVSGSTLTAGTEVTSTQAAGTDYFSRVFVNGNGNIVCQYRNYVTIFKLTGTVEAQSTVALGGSAPSAASGGAIPYTDCLQINASKAIFFWLGAGDSAWYAQIVTDTNGTATVGSAVTKTIDSGTGSRTAGLYCVNNIAKFSVAYTNTLHVLTFDCSATGPTLTSLAMTTNATPATIALPNPSNQYNERQWQTLVKGTVVHTIGIAATTYDSRFIGDTISKVIGFTYNTAANPNATPGTTSSESWIMGEIYSGAGQVIQKVELTA